MAADPRTVTVVHPERGTLDVTPEVAQALTGGAYGPWSRDDADKARIAELEAELARLKGEADPAGPGQEDPHTEVPDKAEDVIDWIGDDQKRAVLARDVENVRPKPRKTVTDHIESVLDTNPNDPAGPGQED